MYEIQVASSTVEKELAGIPRGEREKVIERVRKLAENPRPVGIKALDPGIYRLRIGSFRVIYKVFDNERIILIGRFARKSERTYRNWRTLFRSY